MRVYPAMIDASFRPCAGRGEGGRGNLMELRHPLSGDMAVVKSAPRCKSSFNRCAVALPLVMSHAPSTRQSAVTRSPQKVVWPQRAHLRRHHHHGAPRARRRAWRIVCRPDPLFSPGGRPDATDRTPQNVHFLFAPAAFTPFNSAFRRRIRRLS